MIKSQDKKSKKNKARNALVQEEEEEEAGSHGNSSSLVMGTILGFGKRMHQELSAPELFLA